MSAKRKALLRQATGTAFNKLRKSIMFDMADRLDLLTCFRCKQQIVRIDEFSIDHKEAWEREADPFAAFFDLGNIAFSHFACNVRAAIRYRKYQTRAEYDLAKLERAKHPAVRARRNVMKELRRARRRKLGLKAT